MLKQIIVALEFLPVRKLIWGVHSRDFPGLVPLNHANISVPKKVYWYDKKKFLSNWSI